MSDVLNRLLPEYQFSEHHTAFVRGRLEDVFEAVEAMELSDSRIAHTLIRLWRIVARVLMRDVPDRDMSMRDFLPLVRIPPTDLARGLLGGKKVPKDTSGIDDQAFILFNESGCIKLVWAFWLTDLGNNCVRIDTETRVLCTDARTLRGFRLYWMVIRPWSGLIRMRLLSSIKRAAEQHNKI